jgi:hypothetical protein
MTYVIIKPAKYIMLSGQEWLNLYLGYLFNIGRYCSVVQNCCRTLQAVMNHLLNFVGLYKMVQLVNLNPPCCRFHQLLRIIIFVGKKYIK